MENESLVRLKFKFQMGKRHRQRHKEHSSKDGVHGSNEGKNEADRGVGLLYLLDMSIQSFKSGKKTK